MFLKLTTFLAAVILISVVNSDSEDEYNGPTSAAPDIENELHMDSVPTGYLPDSVYRELAWYGILQIQPLYHSTKHKVAARWIWQNTLGRPHVVLENGPQATESDGKGGQALMEESAKWVRDQRSATDVLMENIRSGGNGLTVRTVISSKQKTAYIIQNGKTYECAWGSEPDIDAFRAQPNMHERQCTEETEPTLVPLDICMEAEFTPVEYSYFDSSWSFCMGDGDRESTYTEDGDLDCGQKKKVTYSEFLDKCAIDSNVVITFEYFGDEPRKDLVHNTTICTTWDPCRFSYLYRIEVPDYDKPNIPITTPDSCDTTFCPECLENYTEEPLKSVDDIIRARESYADALEWVPIYHADFPKYKDRALVGGHLEDQSKLLYVMRKGHTGYLIPGKYDAEKADAEFRFNSEVHKADEPFEIAIPRNVTHLEWVPVRDDYRIFDNAVKAGYVHLDIFLCRALVHGQLIPGRISVANSDSEDEYNGPTSAAPDIENELHMDSVPTGYLPDSVYRELAWYGILQIQPLYHSTKHKVAARWIWQNTLGRPHVVLENGPQATESDGKGGQTLMEESAKWVRDQRSATDVLMENIRSGGNGLTVRTVISSKQKTAYIIQNGKTYECAWGSEPDIDAFRAQPNMHERQCTEETEPTLVPLDICMEAEFTPVEYSYFDSSWSFCMGDGDRESTYTEDGDLDCGQKKKVTYSEFLDKCAIDSNVVITFEYFGDEPRKDLVHNTTICTTWDPCRFAYLYRVELPESPDIPTTTPDPCDTTFCPECVENYSELTNIVDDNAPGGTKAVTTPQEALEWVKINYEDFPQYKDKALKSYDMYIIRASYQNMTLPGKYIADGVASITFNRTEINVTGQFEIAIPRKGVILQWVPASSEFYDNAIPAGVGANGYTTYLCRARVGGTVVPGRYYLEEKVCYNSHDGTQFKNRNFEFLVQSTAKMARRILEYNTKYDI